MKERRSERDSLFAIFALTYLFVFMPSILLISPYWRESHRWMVSTVKLAELWQRMGYKVVVACMGSETRIDRISETLTVHMRKDFFLPDPWNYGISFGFSGFVRRLIKREKPDHIVVNKVLFWTSLCVISLRLRRYRVTLLTDALVGMTWWPRGRIPKICAAIYAWTLGWLILTCARHIVFFHPQPRRLLQWLAITEKSEVIPTGIDPEPYGRGATSYELRATSGKENPQSSKLKAQSSITITYIGRLESVKGVDDFLAATVPLKKEYPRIRIQVVGWYKSGHPLVKSYGQDVNFLGLREDIPAILASTTIFVLPSYSEGLSNALMEAMASGCACIATQVGGNAFLIQNGVSGLLFPPGDREALKAHLTRLINDPPKCRAMGEAARARIQETFSWDKVAKQYGRLFERP